MSDEKTKPMDAFVSDLLNTNRDDPANARYLVPLENAEDEEMALSMADAIYCARQDYFRDDITEEQAERVYEQALIDSRRMLCDKEYWDMIVSLDEEWSGGPKGCPWTGKPSDDL